LTALRSARATEAATTTKEVREDILEACATEVGAAWEATRKTAAAAVRCWWNASRAMR
jgi:hypothetical protein